jgi:hypothetical protein
MPMDEATWLASTHFQKLDGFVKSTQGAALSEGGRRMIRLLACAICRTFLWDLRVPDAYRWAVEAAEAFADGTISGEALAAAAADAYRLHSNRPTRGPVKGRPPDMSQARAALAGTTDQIVPNAFQAAWAALWGLGPQDRAEGRWRICDLLRDIFGNPFQPLPPRDFPAHVVGLARECYDAFPG